MSHHPVILLLSVLAAMLPHTAKAADSIARPAIGIAVSPLPDLNVPRNYHHTLMADGCPIVVGGHTDGFVPTPTAEYFRDGQWHLLNTAYTHDYGMALRLSSGSLLVAGGFKEDLGIGQLHSVEKYSQGAFEGFGCLDTKRAMANGTEIDHGRVVISGNWYADDNIELFDGKNGFSFIKKVAQQRSRPFIFRVSADDVFIFGTLTTKLGEKNDTVIVDRLHGSPFVPPLFSLWKPLGIEQPFCPDQSFIGDETAGSYAYLFPVADNTGQVAIAMLRGETFSLLPTDGPVPMTDSAWQEHADTTTTGWRGDIAWFTPVIADRQRHRAYMCGLCRGEGIMPKLMYVLVMDYGGVTDIGNGADTPSAARLSLRYAEVPSDAGNNIPVLTPDGDLLVAGGNPIDNFHPSGAAYVLHVGTASADSIAAGGNRRGWAWVVLAVAILLAATGAGAWLLRRRHNVAMPVEQDEAERPDTADTQPDGSADDVQLMQRICQLMEQQQLFADSELKITDVVDALKTNRTYISNCISNMRGCSFSQFVNAYRVDYAKQMLQQNPEAKLSEVWTASGFSTESTFFRAFKNICGMTPKEWIAALEVNGKE